jgi:uncharacterized protein
MPEYLAPGVYVEETSFRAKSIEGVGTSTTAFVGPTRKGPFRVDDDDNDLPELLTSYGDFERLYGSFENLELTGTDARTNFVAHAARAFFNEGGSRLYVARVPGSGAALATATVAANVGFTARFPGAAGNGRIIIRQVVTPASRVVMDNAPAGTLLRTSSGTPAVVSHQSWLRPQPSALDRPCARRNAVAPRRSAGEPVCHHGRQQRHRLAAA